MKITIDTAACIECGRCVKVCPSLIFSQSADSAAIAVSNTHSCMVCGHCVDACSNDAIAHQEFPAEKMHPIDYGMIPSPEQVLLLCKARRSNRAFTEDAVPDRSIELILEAAHSAPTGSNTRNISFTVVADPKTLKAVEHYTVNVFMKSLKMIKNPILGPILKLAMPSATKYIPVFERLKREHDKGNDMILRNATALIFIHSPKGSRMGKTDANLAYQNGSLMAQSLGVSHFYTGFVLNALGQDKSGKLESTLGIDGTIHAGMALGMPEFRFPKYADRDKIAVRKL